VSIMNKCQVPSLQILCMDSIVAGLRRRDGAPFAFGFCAPLPEHFLHSLLHHSTLQQQRLNQRRHRERNGAHSAASILREFDVGEPPVEEVTTADCSDAIGEWSGWLSDGVLSGILGVGRNLTVLSLDGGVGLVTARLFDAISSQSKQNAQHRHTIDQKQHRRKLFLEEQRASVYILESQGNKPVSLSSPDDQNPQLAPLSPVSHSPDHSGGCCGGGGGGGGGDGGGGGEDFYVFVRSPHISPKPSPSTLPPMSPSFNLFGSLLVFSINMSPSLSPLVSTSELMRFVRVVVVESSPTLQHLEVRGMKPLLAQTALKNTLSDSETNLC
jgi:hypothetical protein